MKMPIISIVMSTYNGEPVLPDCLKSLAEQTADKETYEVVMINNMSTDGSQKIIDEYAKSQPNFRAFVEPEVGLSAARNRGYKEARGEYVAYFDDDAKVEPEWVSKALAIIGSKHPQVFGGPIVPFYQSQQIPWVKDKYNSYSLYDGSRNLVNGEFLSGSNIFILKSLLEQYGGFNTKLGMKGEATGYHEETALQEQMRKDGVERYYDDNLVVQHLVPDVKQNILYYIYSQYKSGKDGKYLWDASYSYAELLKLFKEIDAFFMGIEQAMKSKDKAAYPYPENYVVEQLVPNLFTIGSRLEYFSKHESIALKDYLEHFVKDRNLSLTEYLQIYASLNPEQFKVDNVLTAYVEVMHGKQDSIWQTLKVYLRSAKLGLGAALKLAVYAVCYSKPIYPVIRRIKSLLHK